MPIDFIRKLPIPKDIKERYPLNAEQEVLKLERDKSIRQIFEGKSKQFMLIIGPCSADRESAILTYVYKLSKIQEKVKDKIILIPRVYTNKPRSRGVGYKGMLHQPDPYQEEDMLKGIIAVRSLHLKIISECGITAADEMLYPANMRYLSDLLSYVAVGARSVENQEHRMLASGLDIPVGMKNPSSGNLNAMLNSIYSAQSSQQFIYRGWEVKTTGNDLVHGVLRGGEDDNGKNIPNYYYEELERLDEKYSENEYKNKAIIVDANHSNSGKKFDEQIRICKDVIDSRNGSAQIGKMVKGLMIESYLEDGRQSISGRYYGKSITDSCLGWDKTEKLILNLADRI